MTIFCKNCQMEFWKGDDVGLFSKDGFGEDCALYIEKKVGAR